MISPDYDGKYEQDELPFEVLPSTIDEGLRGGEPVEDEWLNERYDILSRFGAELKKVTGDGSKKRQAGLKKPWYEDGSHEGAIFSHLTKWKRGEVLDADSGAHPLVHAAWRCLAIACQETGNVPK